MSEHPRTLPPEEELVPTQVANPRPRPMWPTSRDHDRPAPVFDDMDQTPVPADDEPIELP